jgi:hypothetical protein
MWYDRHCHLLRNSDTSTDDCISNIRTDNIRTDNISNECDNARFERFDDCTERERLQ